MGDRLALTDMGGKWGLMCPFGGRDGSSYDTMWPGPIEAYLRAKGHLDPSNRLATMHHRHRQDRTDNGPTE